MLSQILLMTSFCGVFLSFSFFSGSWGLRFHMYEGEAFVVFRPRPCRSISLLTARIGGSKLRSMGFMMMKTCWFLWVNPVSSRRAALQKYCTHPCLPKKVDGRPSGRPNLKGKLWMPPDNSTGSPPAKKWAPNLDAAKVHVQKIVTRFHQTRKSALTYKSKNSAHYILCAKLTHLPRIWTFYNILLLATYVIGYNHVCAYVLGSEVEGWGIMIAAEGIF